MKLELTILGCNAALPTPSSQATAQVLELSGRLFLIDCGEGTQVQLRKYGIKFFQINHILISHLHGDHVFGLIGFISSLQLLGRTGTLYIYGPKGIKKLIETQLILTESRNTFAIVYKELEGTESQQIFEDDYLTIKTIPLQHRIYCNGYLFQEKPKKRRINAPVIMQYPEIAKCDYPKIKQGADYQLKSGEIIPNKWLTLAPHPSLSYAFCSDTAYHPSIIPIIRKVDLIYHEATFMQKDEILAQKTGHSTAIQAAEIARQAQAKQLLLGHYSKRYKNLDLLLQEAQSVFENTHLSFSGKKIKLTGK